MPIQRGGVVADPGFPRGGTPTLQGRANIRFCQNFPKTVWNWKNLGPGGTRIPRPPRSATDYDSQVRTVADPVFPRGWAPTPDGGGALIYYLASRVKLYFAYCVEKITKTYRKRMHSSRMCTVRSSSHVYPSMHCAGVCVYPSMHWAGGGLSSWGVCPDGCLPGREWGVWPAVGVSAWGWLLRGASAHLWMCIPACTEADTPLNRMTDRSL